MYHHGSPFDPLFWSRQKDVTTVEKALTVCYRFLYVCSVLAVVGIHWLFGPFGLTPHTGFYYTHLHWFFALALPLILLPVAGTLYVFSLYQYYYRFVPKNKYTLFARCLYGGWLILFLLLGISNLWIAFMRFADPVQVGSWRFTSFALSLNSLQWIVNVAVSVAGELVLRYLMYIIHTYNVGGIEGMALYKNMSQPTTDHD